MPDIKERTALADFTLDGKPIRKGQVVALDRHQFGRALAAGVIVESDGENDALARADLPPTQGGIDYERQVNEASRDAAERIAQLRAAVADEETKTANAIEASAKRASEAAVDADRAIGEHRERATAAGREADETISAHRQRAEKAGSDADAEIKAHQERARAKGGKPTGGE